MKKALTFIGCCTFIMASCAGNGSSSDIQDTTPVSSQTNNENRSLTDTLGETGSSTTDGSSEFEKGRQLIAGSDCLGCHKEYEKLIGPAYGEVASKYEDTDKNKAYLVDKIIKGGSGVWGEIPMTPHPSISEGDAAEMVNYILSLK